ncbi:unnamed protein product, partial [Phaeothamnion confervicola]
TAAAAAAVNATAAGKAAFNAAATAAAGDGEASDQAATWRFRDSNELLYSLRSLHRYAPWVRRVFLVTNGQLPRWLDAAHPRLTVVTHAEIFPEGGSGGSGDSSYGSSVLPVFSSAAIEAHLHRIPGLAEHFVYFNDDVMLGADTWPEDFLLPSGIQRLYTSWAVPPCASACMDSWLGDGYCDRACNVTACSHDRGDCLGPNVKTRYGGGYGGGYGSGYGGGGGGGGGGGDGGGGGAYGGTYGGNQLSPYSCVLGCPGSFAGDRVCDAKCAAAAECAFDGGDCADG